MVAYSSGINNESEENHHNLQIPALPNLANSTSTVDRDNCGLIKSDLSYELRKQIAKCSYFWCNHFSKDPF